MPRLNRREQLPLFIKRALCAHHVEHPLLRHVDLARWVYAQYGLRPDRSTVGRILKNAERWALEEPNAPNQVRRRGGAWPELEQAMARWIANAGPAGVPLTLQTIHDHVERMARNMGIPPVFRCSIGWVRRALRRQGVRCRAATGEAASADMAAVREAREKVPQLLTHLGYKPRDTFNLDETALWLSVLPRKTYSNARIPGRKVSKDRLTVAFLVNADGSHVFRPLVISKARRPHDFRPDYDPEALCYWRHNAKGWMTSQLNAVMYAEGRHIAVLLDNASSHMLRDECAWSEIVCGMRTTCLSNRSRPLAPQSSRRAGVQAVYDDNDPIGREARRTARAASEMLIGYARAVNVTPRDLCHLFDIRNPIIIERMERASPALTLSTAPPPRISTSPTPPTEAPRPRGRVLPGWMTQPSRRQQLLDGGVGAAMGGYVEAAEWMQV
ncbi:unnamed protein product [Closterium sp. Yama58-4]|nr:unnamed protein product [Closterium sp. Yama58-4]